MEEYKESGIDWIGKIPKNWDIQPLGVCFDERREKVSDTLFEPLSVTKKGILKQLDNVAKSDAHDDRKKVCKDDFVINSRSDRKQSCGLSDYDGSVSLINTVLISNKKMLEPIFVKYLLDNCMFAEEFYRNGHGIVADLWTTNYTEMKRIYIPFPNIKEQQQIADFLDDKIGKIDKILKDLNKQIEILNNYKKSIITEAVTKGLDINVEYKNSGIDWIGNIPKKWQIKRLKYLGTSRNGLTYSPENIVDEDNGILVLRSSNIQSGKLDYHDNVYVNCKVPVNLLLKKNDLLICSRNGSRNLIGKNALIDNSSIGNTFGAFMCVFRGEYNKYIYYIMNSYLFDNYLNSFLTSTINQLTNSNLGNIKVPFTYDIIEQQKIISYLDDKCSNIDKTIQIKKNQIDKLENYKKSLIYEYVTGKKRVKEE